MEFAFSLAGAFVGLLIGLTGVGGGAIMTPLLILVFGVNPLVAVGTDLWFAAATKSVGGLMHARHGSPDWQVVRRLALGSVPVAIATLAWLGFVHGGQIDTGFLLALLGGALIATAVILPIKGRLTTPLLRLQHLFGPENRKHQAMATVAAGAAVGCLVTLTSVGAGALIAVTLMVLYPLRLNVRSVVGTDIIHAVPLALVAAIGHSWLGNVDWSMLLNLLVGSIPGIILGSVLVNRINESLVRVALAIMLATSGIKLILG